MKSSENLVRFQLAVGMATFGSATPVSKLVSQAMPVFIAGALRVALGAFALAPALIRHRRELGRMGRRDWLLVVVIALVGMFGFTAFMLYGMKLASGVAGATVMSTTPAVTALGSIAFLGERPTWRKIVAVGLAIVGVLVIQLGQGGSSGAGNPWLGAGLVFCAVCCEATYTIAGKMAAKDLPPVLVAALAAAISVPIFVPFALWQWTAFDISSVGWSAWLALAWYGLGTLALGSWLWYSGWHTRKDQWPRPSWALCRRRPLPYPICFWASHSDGFICLASGLCSRVSS